jgi:hypothetical protein
MLITGMFVHCRRATDGARLKLQWVQSARRTEMNSEDLRQKLNEIKLQILTKYAIIHPMALQPKSGLGLL